MARDGGSSAAWSRGSGASRCARLDQGMPSRRFGRWAGAAGGGRSSMRAWWNRRVINGATLGRRGLEQVVSGRRTAQGIKIGDAGAVAEGGGEGEPGRVVQPGAASIGQRREQPAVAFPPLVWQPVQVLAQRLPDPGRNPGRIKPLRSRVGHGAGGGQTAGHRGDQKFRRPAARSRQPAGHIPAGRGTASGSMAVGVVHSVLANSAAANWRRPSRSKWVSLSGR